MSVVEEVSFDEDINDLHNLISFSNILRGAITGLIKLDKRGQFTCKAYNKPFLLVEDKYHPVPSEREQKKVNLYELLSSTKMTVDWWLQAKFFKILNQFSDDEEKVLLAKSALTSFINNQ